MREAIGLALAGRAGALLATQLGITVGCDTLLTRVRRCQTPSLSGAATVLAWRTSRCAVGMCTARVLVDMASHRPVDLLDSRDAGQFAAWPLARPGVDDLPGPMRCLRRRRPRGAPNTVQVADRLLLWRNLGEAVVTTVAANRSALAEPAPATSSAVEEPAAVCRAGLCEPPQVVRRHENPITVRKRRRYEEIQELFAWGHSRSPASTSVAMRSADAPTNSTRTRPAGPSLVPAPIP